MDKKEKIGRAILICAVTAVLLLRFVWIYAPSEGTVVLYNPDTGVTIEEPLTYKEAVAVKQILWGKERWPEWLYGSPACGFATDYAVILDGTRYMLAWDSCGTICVDPEDSDPGPYSYIDIADAENGVIEQIITSRDTR